MPNDLNIKTGHGGIPSGGTERVPQYERQESVQPGTTPEFGSAFREYAAASNWMSRIGSDVASKASNALATKIGGEMGKTPTGDLMPSFTDFDKNLAESYSTQAHATLGLQADKLITDSNIELSKASRLTPGLIASAQSKISTGLQQIYSHAPNNIRPQLESTYGQIQLNQGEKLAHRMLEEQREDRKNNSAVASQNNAQIAHTLAMSDDPKSQKAAQAAVETVAQTQKADVDANVQTPQGAKAVIDTARQSMLIGKYYGEAERARQAGKLPEYLKSLADKPPSDLSDQDRQTVLNSVLQATQNDENLRVQAENLSISKFQLAAITNPNDPGLVGQLSDLQQNLPEKKFVDTQIWLQNARNKAARARKSTADVVDNYQNYDTFNSDFTDKERYAAHQQLSTAEVEQSGGQTTMAEAEAHQAAASAGPISGWIDKINGKATSGNPTQLNEATASVEYVRAADKPENLKGLSPEALASMRIFAALKDTHGDVLGAQMAKEAVHGKTTEQLKANQIAYDTWVAKTKSAGMSNDEFALSVAGIDKNALVNVPELSHFVEAKLQGYFNLYNGDVDQVKEHLKDDIDMSFGYETINGHKQFSYRPLNKVYNIPDEANGFVYNDLVDQLTPKFAQSKTDYDNKKADFYWEVIPRMSVDDMQKSFEKVKELEATRKSHLFGGFFETRIQGGEKEQHQAIVDQFLNSGPPKIIQHWRNGDLKTYEIDIKNGPGISNNYDVGLRSGKNGHTTIALADPHTGSATYIPNRQKIMDGYRKIVNTYDPFLNSIMFKSAAQLIGGMPALVADKAYANFVQKNIKEREKMPHVPHGTIFKEVTDEQKREGTYVQGL